MEQTTTSCLKCVGGQKICTYCGMKLLKHGFSKSGKQRYKCKNCWRTQIDYYTYRAYHSETNNQIINLTKEGCGIRSTSRLLKIAPNTVVKRILAIANAIKKPMLHFYQHYQMDEIRTFIKNKSNLYWVAYAIRTDTKEIADFALGRRTNKTLRKVTDVLLLSEAKKIATDKLRNYRSLIPALIHNTKHRATNHIERHHLTLRTHLKRLSRKTICFSKSAIMLSACLKIYFWGH